MVIRVGSASDCGVTSVLPPKQTLLPDGVQHQPSTRLGDVPDCSGETAVSVSRRGLERTWRFLTPLLSCHFYTECVLSNRRCRGSPASKWRGSPHASQPTLNRSSSSDSHVCKDTGAVLITLMVPGDLAGCSHSLPFAPCGTRDAGFASHVGQHGVDATESSHVTPGMW